MKNNEDDKSLTYFYLKAIFFLGSATFLGSNVSNINVFRISIIIFLIIMGSCNLFWVLKLSNRKKGTEN